MAVAHAMGRKALYRINRDVSLSRAIGDMDLKEFGERTNFTTNHANLSIQNSQFFQPSQSTN